MKPVAFSARLLLLSLLPGACHQVAPRPNVGPKAGQTIGDTAAFGPRLRRPDVGHHAGGSRGSHHEIRPPPRAQGPAPTVASWSSADQTDYDRCVRSGMRGLTKKRLVRTDSSGKT